MNIETLRNLKKNPHYKLTAEQEEELRLAEQGSDTMVTIGVPQMHNQKIPVNSPRLIRSKYEQK